MPRRIPFVQPRSGIRRRRYRWLSGFLALAYLAGAIATDAALPSRYQVIDFFGVAAIIAATTLEWRLTALIGLVAVFAGLLTGQFDDGGVARVSVTLALCSVAATAGAATVVAGIRERRESRLAAMTEVAETAEHAIVRTAPISLPDLEVATVYRSAANVGSVGGDLYEAVATPYGSRLIIGDARGKGLPAVQMAAVVLGAFRHAALAEPDLGRLVTDLDRTVAAFATEEDFVTALVMEVNGLDIRIVCCGHPWPLIGPPGYVRPVQFEADLPLGLGGPREVQVRGFPTRQILIAYTDGLIEAKNREGQMLSIETLAKGIETSDPRQALDEIEARLAQHLAGPLTDDLTVLAMRHRNG